MQFAVRKNIFFCILFLAPIMNWGQNNPVNYRHITIAPNIDSIILDTVSINPYTFSIKTTNGSTLSKSAFRLNPINAHLFLNEKQKDSLTVSSQLLGLDFTQEYFFHDTSLMNRQQKEDYVPFRIPTNAAKSDIFSGTQLNKTGSLSRGIMLGNNQNFSLNSNFFNILN